MPRESTPAPHVRQIPVPESTVVQDPPRFVVWPDGSIDDVRYREIADFPGYTIGDNGFVWSRRTNGGKLREKWKALKPVKHENDYLYVKLCINRKDTIRGIHTLVLEAFVGPCPPGMLACHDPDHNRANNRLVNLRWDTQENNMQDSIRQGRIARGSRAGGSKLTESDVISIRQQIKNGGHVPSIANTYGVAEGTIWNIKSRRIWAHI
jgi:hypothetical protein